MYNKHIKYTFNMSNHTNIPNYSQLHTILIKKLEDNDIIIVEEKEENTRINFIPFINTCKDSELLQSLIQDPSIYNSNE
jgi:hypothetical protein